MDAGGLVGHVPTWVLLIIVGAPGVWAVWKQWSDNRKTAQKERVDLIKLAQDVSKDAIGYLEDRVAALEAELTELRKEHADTIASKDAELALLRGQLRQALALAQSYEQKLADAGIPHEKPRQPFWGIEAGSAPTELIEGRLP